MKVAAWLIIGCLAQMPARAADNNACRELSRPYACRSLLTPGAPARFAATMERKSVFARAIESAASKGVIERGVEGYTEVLIQCQKAQSTVLTTPFMRSDSQQAHCYRF